MKRFVQETLVLEGVHCEKILDRVKEFTDNGCFSKFSPELIIAVLLEYAKYPRGSKTERIRYVYDKCLSYSAIEMEEYQVKFEDESDEDSWYLSAE
jgi:hypothetical protein